MSPTILDQRKSSGGKHMPNKGRLLERQRGFLRDAVRRQISQESIKTLGSGPNRNIPIPGKTLHEPTFHHSGKGIYERVLPGNKTFNPGDKIPVSGGSGSGGSQGSPEGDEEGIQLEISEEEYFDILFEGLELPDLMKKRLAGVEEMERVRAGIAREGPYSKIHVPRSLGNAHVRRKAATIKSEKKIKALEEERRSLEALPSPETEARIKEIDDEIIRLRRRINAIPFFDPMDLRFRRFSEEPKPITKAVMFCLLDVSASMADEEMEIAKLFFILLNRFLTRSYQQVDIRFLQHTTVALEMPEEQFFKTRRTGGTVVSTVYELMMDIVHLDYPITEWNIYAAQCSDGEDTLDDLPLASDMLESEILPCAQYFAYAEINKRPEALSALWKTISPLLESNPNLAMRHLRNKGDIYPVFRNLFERRAA